MTSFKDHTKNQINRREFLWLMGCAGTAAMVTPLTGCMSTDPVTGERGFVLMSEQQEIAIDKQQSPHQFSSDYGVSQDTALNQYLNSVGQRIAAISHRPHMPYNFQVVNATYVNAYAFPGGSIAATRGILLEMENEAELAALIGHEVAHVNARHTAERATRSQLAGMLASAATVLTAQSEYNQYTDIVNTLGGMGAGALLSRYSRDNEREADSLGVEYMVKSGQNPQGMVGLMEMLNGTKQREPNIIEQMFSSHPMSSERYQTAVAQVNSQYGAEKKRSFNKDRYMDSTAKVRRIKETIKGIQAAENEMNKGNFSAAESHFESALKRAPNDYCGLVMSAKCQLTQEKLAQAERLLEKAKSVYPQEAQAVHLSGVTKLKLGKNESAFNEFRRYEERMPGNPNSVFFQGFSLDRMQEKERAATEYMRFLKQVNQGEQAKHAYARLTEWGYIKPQG
ncbi:peptidase M48 Ste24p [Alteromonas sediminis]|uniref:Peptidase M48 Ste24p n=1 Tax=Alteromonas sediminis TaxID=2259342 RepID=A0A3N5Y0X7_9ALTE|nr:M48 family metalloprotease [Alteromonas sediminis]RPJ66573.1 peptidase M48 Ste24p [Alteromonas sediminis]